MAVIRELIDRMMHGDFENARNEARNITDPEALEEIKSVLNLTKVQAEKKYAY